MPRTPSWNTFTLGSIFLVLGTVLGTACSNLERATLNESANIEVAQSAQGLSTARAQPRVIERQLIRTVTLTLQVENLPLARRKAEELARSAGGFVEGLESSTTAGSKHTDITLRVPKLALDSVVAAAKKLGSAHYESQKVEDVTRKVIDSDARLRNMQKTEERLLVLLEKQSSALADVLAVERELSRVREESEVLTSELAALREQVALCTLVLKLVQESDFNPPQDTWTDWRYLMRNAGNIVASSFGALMSFCANVLTTALYLLPWLPLLVLAWFGVRRWRKRKRK